MPKAKNAFSDENNKDIKVDAALLHVGQTDCQWSLFQPGVGGGEGGGCLLR